MRNILSIVLLFTSLIVKAINPPFFNNYYNNHAGYNPAFAGFERKTNFMAVGAYGPFQRNSKWIDNIYSRPFALRQGYSSQLSAGTFIPIGKSYGIGLAGTYTNYNSKIENNNSVKIGTSFQIPISDGYLGLGIGLDRNFDKISEYIPPTYTSAIISRSVYTNIEMGIAYINLKHHYYGGVSFVKAGKLPVQDSFRRNNDQTIFSGGTDIELKNGKILKPGFVTILDREWLMQMIGSVQLQFKSKLFTAVSYNSASDAFGLTIGKEWKMYKVSYTYNNEILKIPYPGRHSSNHQIGLNLQL